MKTTKNIIEEGFLNDLFHTTKDSLRFHNDINWTGPEWYSPKEVIQIYNEISLDLKINYSLTDEQIRRLDGIIWKRFKERIGDEHAKND
jgi:hypothetical protein